MNETLDLLKQLWNHEMNISHSKTTRQSIALQERGKTDFQSSSVMDCGMRSTFHKESFSEILIICFFSTIRVTFWRSFETSEDETLVNEEVKSKKVNCVRETAWIYIATQVNLVLKQIVSVPKCKIRQLDHKRICRAWSKKNKTVGRFVVNEADIWVNVTSIAKLSLGNEH